LWSESEIDAFENGMEEYTKDFSRIKKYYMAFSHKTVRHLVAYYYIWKHTSRYLIWQSKTLESSLSVSVPSSPLNSSSEEVAEPRKRKLCNEDTDMIVPSPLACSEYDDCAFIETKKRRFQSSSDETEEDDRITEPHIWDSRISPFGVELPFEDLSYTLQQDLVSQNSTDYDFMDNIFNTTNDVDIDFPC